MTKLSAETKAKISAERKTRTKQPMAGRKHTAATLKKMSKAQSRRQAAVARRAKAIARQQQALRAKAEKHEALLKQALRVGPSLIAKRARRAAAHEASLPSVQPPAVEYHPVLMKHAAPPSSRDASGQRRLYIDGKWVLEGDELRDEAQAPKVAVPPTIEQYPPTAPVLMRPTPHQLTPAQARERAMAPLPQPPSTGRNVATATLPSTTQLFLEWPGHSRVDWFGDLRRRI